MNNIKPCPFCGGKSRVHKYLGKWYARCNKCKAYSAPYDTEEQATEAWNRRTAESIKEDGDEVRLNDGTKGVVVFSSSDSHLNVVNSFGGIRSYNATEVVKTGRHFPQMVEMMKEMRDNDENDKHR